jgi:hypothetical protein
VSALVAAAEGVALGREGGKRRSAESRDGDLLQQGSRPSHLLSLFGKIGTPVRGPLGSPGHVDGLSCEYPPRARARPPPCAQSENRGRDLQRHWKMRREH